MQYAIAMSMLIFVRYRDYIDYMFESNTGTEAIFIKLLIC